MDKLSKVTIVLLLLAQMLRLSFTQTDAQNACLNNMANDQNCLNEVGSKGYELHPFSDCTQTCDIETGNFCGALSAGGTVGCQTLPDTCITACQGKSTTRSTSQRTTTEGGTTRRSTTISSTRSSTRSSTGSSSASTTRSVTTSGTQSTSSWTSTPSPSTAFSTTQTAAPTLTTPDNACRDTYALCKFWAWGGQCNTNSRFMTKCCPKACNCC